MNILENMEIKLDLAHQLIVKLTMVMILNLIGQFHLKTQGHPRFTLVKPIVI